MTGLRRDAGLTLIELVVAMAVFALIAIMGLQSLTGALRLRDDLSLRADRSAHLIQTTAQIRNDLARVVPVLFFPPDSPARHSALREIPSGGFAMSLSGVPLLSGLAPEDPGLRRVEWRFDDSTGALTRLLWPTLYPVEAAQAGPDVLVLEGVRSLRLRSYWSGKGWISGLVDNEAVAPSPVSGDGDGGAFAPENYSDTLPRAMEITLETEEFGEITLVEFLQ